jgi:hypothetical protein
MDNDKRDIMDLFNLGEQYRGAVMVSKVDLSGVGSRFAAPNNSEKVTVVFGAMTPQNGYSYWTTNPNTPPPNKPPKTNQNKKNNTQDDFFTLAFE